MIAGVCGIAAPRRWSSSLSEIHYAHEASLVTPKTEAEFASMVSIEPIVYAGAASDASATKPALFASTRIKRRWVVK